MRTTLVVACLALVASALPGCANAPTPGPPAPSAAPHARRIVLVSAEPEYRSAESLARLAQRLQHDLNAQTTLLRAQPASDAPDNIPGMDALDQADLVVVFMRFCRLPEAQLAPLDRFLRAGKPVIGLRTSTHAFAYDGPSRLNSWNSFGPRVLGAPWIEHAGGDTSTRVTPRPNLAGPEAQILRGVTGFDCRSWLYALDSAAPVLGDFPPQDATILADGVSLSAGIPAPRGHPVAWTWRTPWGGRVFTTTLGHPEDFDRPELQRLLLNAARWAMDVSPSPASR